MYQAPSECLFKWIKVDILYFFKKLFLFWVCMNIQKAWKAKSEMIYFSVLINQTISVCAILKFDDFSLVNWLHSYIKPVQKSATSKIKMHDYTECNFISLIKRRDQQKLEVCLGQELISRRYTTANYRLLNGQS